jgi:hypothetical protein
MNINLFLGIIILVLLFLCMCYTEGYSYEHKTFKNPNNYQNIQCVQTLPEKLPPPDVNLQCGGYQNVVQCMKGMNPDTSNGVDVLKTGLVCSTCTK